MKIEEVSRYYLNNSGSIRETARRFGISHTKVRKCLITTGAMETPLSRKIIPLLESGLTVRQIADRLGVSTTCVSAHSPYTKGEYNSDEPSSNALAIRAHRERKAQK